MKTQKHINSSPPSKPLTTILSLKQKPLTKSIRCHFMPRTNATRYILQAKKLWRNLASSLNSNLSRFKRSKSLKRFRTILGGKRSRFIHARRVHRHVYVDELYMQPVAPAYVEQGEMTSHEMKKKNVIKKNEAKDYCYIGCSPYDNSNNAVGSSSKGAFSEMEEVDIRAEIFINKFKEEMRLQRQQSFNEYQEMLARGV